MRIGWVTEATPRAVPSTADAYKESAPAGLELVLCSGQNLEAELDAYIVFDATGFHNQELDEIVSKPHVMVPQGWWLAYEEQGKYRDPLYTSARACVFMSPLHQRHWLDLHHNVVPSTGYVIPPPIDPLTIYTTQDRNEGCFWAQDWHPHNGPDLAARWAERAGLDLDMYSPTVAEGPTSFNKRAVFKSWPVAPEHMFAQYKRYIHLNRYPDPFGYRIAMAYLSGVEAVVSGQVGIESFEEPIQEVIDRCYKAPEDFWTLMEKVLS